MKVSAKAMAVLGNVGRALKAKSPQIAMAVGTVTSVLAIVEAIKQTPKAIDIIEDHKEAIEDCKVALESGNENFGMREYKINICRECGHTAVALAKTYAVPVIMEAASLACFFGAHKIMSDRNKLLSAALATATDAYNNYRNKVIEAIGEEEEEKIRLGLSQETVTTEIEDENGKIKKVKNKVNVLKDPLNVGPYDIVWMPGDPGWDPSDYYKEDHIKSVEEHVDRVVFGEYHDGKLHGNVQDRMSWADVVKFFKERNEAYTPFNMEVLIDKNLSDDKFLRLRYREVSIPDPDNAGKYIDAWVISPNLSGITVTSTGKAINDKRFK